jgi:two-component system chemotaxis sensor kinase CheA
VRNAIAHGIEAPVQRIAAGKPDTGRIDIEVVRRGSRVAFLCRDDGAGVDLDALRSAARARGVQGGRSTGEAELLDLMLGAGVTTAPDVTEASGRGVGLEVARDVARRLEGKLAASTVRGAGTTVELEVPVSLAAVDALLVEAASVIAAVPVRAVHRTIRLAPEDVSRTAGGLSIADEGASIPFLPLTSLLDPRQGSGIDERSAVTAVVLGGGEGRVALGVSGVRGGAEVVIRPPPPLARAREFVAGFCFDSIGMPQLVLDPEALCRAALDAQYPAGPARPRPAPILVIDDSLTTRVLEQSILESAGYVVELAASAEEGLEKAHAGRYSLFLVDVEMPGMDGFGFVAATRADPELRTVPAVLVTSRAADEDRRRGFDAGASGYVVKGEFDQIKVLEMIRELLAP